MNIKKTTLFIALTLFSITSLPLLTRAQTSTSKYSLQKDVDGDGIKNKNDKCPSTPPGVNVDGTGCPVDTDKDGIPDYLDNCPTIAGSTSLNGCQDKDNDGVSDFDDLCPDVPGLARFKGCPDSDGDGIEDSKDKCPNAAGADIFQGCPDSDGDGVEDSYDKCPDTKKGVKVDAKGCAADTDGDGVLDADDKCPGTQLGVKVDAMGCPADTDGDGVADAIDNCPTVMGDVANNGCPVVKKDAPAPKRLQFATRKINFESGNALIKVASFPMLDEVANILKEYPDYNLRIGGHTDAVEKTATTLSQSRIDATKSYLEGKGVAESRIDTASFGKTRPVSSNANATARAQNRRVELELYLR
jgi:outer membrane protein OmpA-like peptidoglycan-associated protein